ncbi:MAG: hypothetical protein K2X47_01880, partial [Bdellovibrionales bacterium]|nr:hypothetical protein [Bdellovibrionales bacterium]
CEFWDSELNLVEFSRCKKDNIDFAGSVSLKSAAGNESKELNFKVTISEKDKVGGRIEVVASKLEVAITQMNLESEQGATKIYSAALKISETGEDQARRPRVFEATGKGLRLKFENNKLTAFRFGTLTVKLQRDQLKINKTTFVESKTFIVYDQRFWKGSVLTMDADRMESPRTEVAFAEGILSLPEKKEGPAVSVQCTADKVGESLAQNQSTTVLSQPVTTTTTTKSAADVRADAQTAAQKKAAAVLRCLVANLHQFGLGK